MALVSACALLWQGEQCLLSQHRLTAQHSAWNSLAWLTCLLNLSTSSVTFSCPSSLFLWELVLWKRFKHTSSSPMAVAAYSSHNQNLCVKMSALGALQVFVSHHSCQNPTCKLPWPGAEDPVDKIDSLQNWLDGSTGCLYSAARPWCLHSAELLHHSGHHFWQPLHLKCSIILSEEILLPRTKDSILEMGLCTQHLHTSHLPFLLLLCLFFFYSLQPTSFCPFCPLMTMVGCSHRLLMRICGKKGPVIFRSVCVGSAALDALRGTVWPQASPWAQMAGEAQLMLFSFLPGLTLGQRWGNKKNKDLGLSSPSFSASTPSRVSSNGNSQPQNKLQAAPQKHTGNSANCY